MTLGEPDGSSGASGAVGAAGPPGGLIGRKLGVYLLVGLLGVGGMAEVYRAHDTKHRREVAVKVLPPALARDPSYVARFRKEAERMAAFTHPYVVPFYGYGEEGGLLYLVMPLLTASVRDRLDREGALDPMEATRLAYQVAAALDAAHRRGLVHRDVKPENILLGADGRALLTDFGIARALDPLQSSTGPQTLSVTGLPVGTPEYMAPEQLRGQPLDQRIDIYSLGIVFFEMLTGQVPFDAETPYAVAARVLKDDVPPPSSLNSRVWPALDLVVQNAVARDPAERYLNMRSFAMDLRTAASRAGRSNPRWMPLEKVSEPIVNATRLTPSAAEPSQPLPPAPGPNSMPNSGTYWGLNTATLAAPASAPMYVPGGAPTPNYASASTPRAAAYIGAKTVPAKQDSGRRLSLPVIAAILLAIFVLAAIGIVILLHGLSAGGASTTPGVHPRPTATLAGTPGHQGAVSHPSGAQPTATPVAQATATPGAATATPTSGAAPHVALATSSVTLAANGGTCTGTQTMTNDGTVPATFSWSGQPHGSVKYSPNPASGITLTPGQSVPVTITEGSPPCSNASQQIVTVSVTNGTASPESFTLFY